MEKAESLCTYLAKATDGISLSYEESQDAMDLIMSGKATSAQVAAFLTALRMKGETIDEISGLARGMRDKAAKIEGEKDAVEIVGTGGDLAKSFNISTTSAFVIAASGVKVAKHGNRSVSSKSGAADVLEALGVKIQSTPETAKQALDTIGISFLFAQSYHTSMKYVGPVRKEMGIRTVFNILGPLTNPAETDYNVIGSYSNELLSVLANVMKKLNTKHTLVIHGNDGLDEASISDSTSVAELVNGEIKEYTITPEEFGLKRGKKEDVVGGTAQDNAKITLGILKGEIVDSKRDIVLLNSGLALYAAGKTSSIKEGVELAKELIDSKKALEKLNALIEFTNR
jgi:anthranilate synthase/phosphoribosyltransferase